MDSIVKTWILVIALLASIADSLPAVENGENVYSEVTYPGIGTFTSDDFYDAKIRPVVFLPQSPEHIATKFYLNTRLNPKDHQEIKLHDIDSIKNSHFDAKNPTKFLVHGFLDNQQLGHWMPDMTAEFLLAGAYNVFIVDWSGGNGLPYGQATANTRVVGPVIAMLIQELVNATGIDLSSVHILGHSLGSHVAGYAGQKLKGLGRITGLDPAGPYFEGLPAAARLDPTDAVFVDAIHSDAKHLLPDLGFGMYETAGHVDFYPNGGVDQPGCDSERFTTILTAGLVDEARKLVACNHQRAVDFYQASINHIKIKPVAYQCQDYQSFLDGKCTDCGVNGEKCGILGYEVESWSKFKSTNAGHRFFLKTGDKSPYFIYEYEVLVKLPAGHSDQHGTMYITFYATGVVERTPLNDKEQDFNHGKTYAFILRTDADYGDIHSVTFSWHRLLGIILKSKLYVESITVVPLTSANIMDKEKHAKEIKVFCPKSPSDGIENEKETDFTTSCK